jgi:hypothetical protein
MHGGQTCVAQPKSTYGVRFSAVPTHGSSVARYSPASHDYIDAFYQALSSWKRETSASSFIEDKVGSEHFRKIVNLGRVVIPFIVDELRTEPSFLFLALEEITGENPVPVAAQGKPGEMVEYWLMWAEHAPVNAA